VDLIDPTGLCEQWVLSNKHEFGTAFVDSKVIHLVANFTPIIERLCILRVKGRFFNYSLINRPRRRRPKINFMNSWSEFTLLARRTT
jgi:hypothetical protein